MTEKDYNDKLSLLTKLYELQGLLKEYEGILQKGLLNDISYILYKFFTHPYLYISLIIGLSFIALYNCAIDVFAAREDFIFSILWLAGFFILVLNVAYIFACSLYSVVIKPDILKEANIAEVPKAAILYTIRNEEFGLYERIEYTFKNNYLENVDLWFLSDSDSEYIEYEQGVIQKLKEKFGEAKIKYRNRKVPFERKQGNIRDWLINYGKEYKYFLVCDADTVVPEDVLLKLIRKAEHPENSDIAIFQSRLNVAHAKTIFSKCLAIGAEFSQRLFTKVNQKIFGRSMSYGSGCLVRRECFEEIEIPKGILSHDIWDTILLDQKGYRTAFCYDVVSYEEVPSNYLDSCERDRRWLTGNMQTYPLLFLKGISFGSRFYLFYGLYIYLCQPIFFLWLLASFYKAQISGHYLPIQALGYSSVFAPHSRSFVTLICILAVVFGHNFILCRSLTDIKKAFQQILLSTLILLNNIYYQTVFILLIPFKKIDWIPMKKNPYEELTSRKILSYLWPTTVLGVIATYYALQKLSFWLILALPFMISFMFAIPLTYYTSFIIEDE